jgi:hypothetical protein
MMAAALLCPGLAVHAQDSKESSPYKVDFTIRDTGDAGGKTGRKYSLLMNRNQKTVFKVGNRVPVATGGTNSAGMLNTQFTYIDVGLNIDCVLDERGSKFAIHADLDISTAVTPDKNLSSVQNPTISQIKLNLDTILAPGKPTTVASFDDPVTSRKFDVDVTVTKM